MRALLRIATIAVLLIVSAGLVFGSGQKQKQDEGDGATNITWWALSGGGGGEDPREQFRQELISEYEAQNPNVNIELTMLENEAFKQKVQVAIQAGNPPDIFHSWGGGVMVEYAEAGMLRDITAFAEDELMSRVGRGPMGVYGFDGKYYGAPYDMGGVVMWYNQEIFDEVGVEVPQTWNQLLSVVREIKNAGYTPIALGAGDRWPAHFWWSYLAMRVGGQEAFNAAYTGEGSFADEPFVRAGELLQELAALEPFQTGYLGATFDDELSLMADEEAAMELMGQWALSSIESNAASDANIAERIGIFRFPTVQGGAGDRSDVLGGGNGYVIGANAPDEALDFLSFFMQPEYNRQLVDVENIIPTVEGASSALEGNPHAQQIADMVSNANYYQLYYDQFLPPAVGEAVKDAVVALLAGRNTPADTAQQVQAAWEDAQAQD